VAFDPEPGRIDFHRAFASGRRFACPHCGAEHPPVHDTLERDWRHLNFFPVPSLHPRQRYRVCDAIPAPGLPQTTPRSWRPGRAPTATSAYGWRPYWSPYARRWRSLRSLNCLASATGTSSVQRYIWLKDKHAWSNRQKAGLRHSSAETSRHTVASGSRRRYASSATALRARRRPSRSPTDGTWARRWSRRLRSTGQASSMRSIPGSPTAVSRRSIRSSRPPKSGPAARGPPGTYHPLCSSSNRGFPSRLEPSRYDPLPTPNAREPKLHPCNFPSR